MFRPASGSIQFPVGIDRTEFVKSEDWAGIQLTDVIAGAFNKACQWNWDQRPADDAYGAAVGERLTRTEDRACMFMMPGPAPERMQHENTSELVDFLSQRYGEFKELS